MSIRVNKSDGIAYHTQRNNERIPLHACQVTAYIMAGKQAGHVHDMVPRNVQPEDYLLRYTLDQDAREYARGLGDWVKAYMPDRLNEVHGVLADAYNRMMGQELASFRTSVPIEQIVRLVDDGHGVVCSGVFPSATGDIDHVVSIAGFMLQDEDAGILRHNITRLIIDDPYGNYHKGYRDQRGNDVLMPAKDAVSMLKEQNSEFKWAHVIKRA